MTRHGKNIDDAITGRQRRRARERRHILLAEDDEEFRSLLASVLRGAGYSVTACLDGLQLLAYLEPYVCDAERESDHRKVEGGNLDGRIGTHPNEEGLRFDLVISDVRMPGVTGLEVLEGMSSCEEAPPLILITAFGDEETHERAHTAGAIAILDKPFEIDVLLAEVDRVLVNGDDTCELIPRSHGNGKATGHNGMTAERTFGER